MNPDPRIALGQSVGFAAFVWGYPLIESVRTCRLQTAGEGAAWRSPVDQVHPARLCPALSGRLSGAAAEHGGLRARQTLAARPNVTATRLNGMDRKKRLSLWVAVAMLAAGCSEQRRAPLFEEVTEAAGLAAYVGMTHGVAWGDFDGDDRPDLYVTNHLDAPLLFRNLGNGKFAEVTQSQWREVMGTEPAFARCDNCPVEMVSWYMAATYANALSERAVRLAFAREMLLAQRVSSPFVLAAHPVRPTAPVASAGLDHCIPSFRSVAIADSAPRAAPPATAG